MNQLSYKRGRITWGSPAKITLCILDEICPICGKNIDNGLDLGYINNHCFGATCICGYSF